MLRMGSGSVYTSVWCSKERGLASGPGLFVGSMAGEGRRMMVVVIGVKVRLAGCLACMGTRRGWGIGRHVIVRR